MVDPVTDASAPIVPPGVDEGVLLDMDTATPQLQQPVFEAEPQELDASELVSEALAADIPHAASQPTRPLLTSSPTRPPLHLPPPAPPQQPPPSTPSTLPLSTLHSQLLSAGESAPTTPYAFTYSDASSLEEELEEWFSYAVEEQAMLLKSQAGFALRWAAFHGRDGEAEEEAGLEWEGVSEGQRGEFVASLIEVIREGTPGERLGALEACVYVLLGCWYETAGLGGDEGAGAYAKSGRQVGLIQRNVRLLVDAGGLQTLVNVLRSSCLRACGVISEDELHDGKEAERRETWCAMTAVYIVLEVARYQEKTEGDLTLRSAVLDLKEPGLLMLLVEIISKLRWDESINLPLSKVTLLLWKTMLVCFGGLAEVEKAKDSFRDATLDAEDARGQPIITASPLDYHLFRQEISSKYPAYNPPAPLFPLEPENNSILPPLRNHPNKVAGNHVFGSGLGDTNGNTSILHQPVHIATPAPSPPPSPAGPGGKGGKKQNYQTNQMFPFLYPPLDESSNNLGGKGSTDLQDLLVGRKWEGSDIPASILEAAELFAKRMRATRAMKQLWEERVAFMKYERGWSGPDDPDIEELSLEPKEPKEPKETKEKPAAGSIEERMGLVEDFYRNALSNMQSLIIILIKAILAHVTALVTQSSANGLQSGFQYNDNMNGARPETNGNGHTPATNEELDAMRTQEVLDKAVTGTLLLILKWFKVSHILKFEYITQLLVDSSYIPLILKLLQLQEIDKLVNFKTEQAELNLFAFCTSHSRNFTPTSPPSSPDSAAPPPIRRSASPTPLPPPEVDELGFPTTPLPPTPITTFSWRAFFTNINYMRIMQKLCKTKAHRNLMLVSYKSSQFLRRNLKIPQPLLRLYTLKLFKNQVPFCGRKWRQANMRVITAVYLHCRPELRDEWLAGADVDADVDESVPREMAGRSLVHWWHLRNYPEGLGARRGVLGGEVDFFRAELEKMDWGAGALGGPEDEAEWAGEW